VPEVDGAQKPLVEGSFRLAKRRGTQAMCPTHGRKVRMWWAVGGYLMNIVVTGLDVPLQKSGVADAPFDSV
jgi:hypothetical protein